MNALLMNGRLQGTRCDCHACAVKRARELTAMQRADRTDAAIILRHEHRRVGHWSLAERRSLQAGAEFERNEVAA